MKHSMCAWNCPMEDERCQKTPQGTFLRRMLFSPLPYTCAYSSVVFRVDGPYRAWSEDQAGRGIVGRMLRRWHNPERHRQRVRMDAFEARANASRVPNALSLISKLAAEITMTRMSAWRYCSLYHRRAQKTSSPFQSSNCLLSFSKISIDGNESEHGGLRRSTIFLGFP
jgi:hypothetical protein